MHDSLVLTNRPSTLRSLFSAAVLTLAFIILSFPSAVGAQTASIADGMLVRAEADTKIYLIDGGKRRAVESMEALQAQGLQGSVIVTVSAAQLNAYPQGENVTTQSVLVFPSEANVLPDLLPFAAEDTRLQRVGGRVRLAFTAAFWNHGKGPMEIFTAGLKSVDGDYPAFQRIKRPDGQVREVPIGSLFWHVIHGHYHYKDFANYLLEKVNTDGSISSQTADVQKSTFCLRDDRSVTVAPEGPRGSRTYVGCGGGRQGVSVGWADVYPFTLPDQFFDVTDLPAGRYRLSFEVDPLKRFVESDKNNNRSSVYVDIDPAALTLKVVARISPYSASDNRFPEGAVLRVAGSTVVYAIHNNKWRQLLTDAAVAAHGTPAGTFDVSKAVIDGLGRDMLVRVKGTSPIYLINEQNYYRKILNPTVFASYGFNMADVADISAEEFATYQPNDLVMRSGDNRVYSLRTKKLIGSFASLPSQGLALAAVQLINATDFNAYAMNVVAEGLEIPWSLAFLPDGDILVTERPGRLRQVGKHPATIAIPSITAVGEGGLMGIALHPKFAENQQLFLFYTAQIGSIKQNRVSRFTLVGDQLTDEKLIVGGIPSAIYHDGGLLAFGPDGMLYITVGDAQQSDLAQDVTSFAGKILRFTAEGGIPADNPFGTAIWSYGHRNPQGLAWDSAGRLWETEHGPTAGVNEPGRCCRDELNLIVKGGNYGWPTIYGDTTGAGMITPVANSGTTIAWAPSGMAYVGGTLYFSGLIGSSLYSATVTDAGGVTGVLPHLVNTFGRLRAVVQGPDGALYVTTSNRDGRGTVRAGDDKILRIFPEMLQ